MGEASNFFLSPIVDASLAQILGWGVADIAATLEVKTDEIAQKVENLGLTVPPKKMRSPHLIGVTLPRGIPRGLGDQLAANSIFVSIRGDAIRIAPHLYTTQADIGRLFDLLAAC
jgi:selenocysteine lyase/cysteine desulfurase